MPCFQCGKDTANPKFCGRSCSARFNNKNYPKRKPEGICKTCGVVIAKSLLFCKKCSPPVDWSVMTVSQCKQNTLTAYHSQIRYHARRLYMLSGRPRSCKVCQYSLHFEVCHIKPLSSFSDDTLIIVVNDQSNLIALCRNCHWEFDHGYLKIE